MLFGLTACQENIDVFVPFDTNPSSLSDGLINRLFDNLSPAISSYEWDASESKVLQTPNGANISFPANAFVKDGEEFISGTISLNLVEVLSAGKMIIHDMPNVASGEMLEAAGNFLLEVEQEGHALQLAPNQRIHWELPINPVMTGFNPAMKLFFGNSQNPTFFNWEYSGTDVQLIELQDSVTMEPNQAYHFVTDRLGWIGCNAYIQENQQWTSLCVELPEGFNAKNTAVYAAFQSFTGVAKLFENEARETAPFCKDLIPSHSDVMLVVLAEGGEGVYFFNSTMIHVEGETLSVALQPERATLEEIETFLKEL